jgi:phage gpG-like protein
MSKTMSWEIDASEAIKLIDDMKEAMVSYHGPLSEATKFLRVEFGVNFDSQGAQVGFWKPLSPVTAAWRAEHGYPPTNPILVNEGDLQAAVWGARPDVRDKDATLSVNHRLAPFHQFGSTKVHLPAREIVFVPKGFAELMAARLAGHIVPGRMTSSLKKLFRR